MPVSRVLVIEGEVEARRILADGLSSRGYDVRACKDGVSAIHELEHSHSTSSHFDYVIADAQLTDISGIKIMRVLKSAWPGLPMVIVSEYEDDDLKKEVAGFDNASFLKRPFETDSVIGALEGLKPAETTEEHKHLSEGKPKVIAKAIVFANAMSGTDVQALVSTLANTAGVHNVNVVSGEMQLVFSCWQRSMEELDKVLTKVRGMEGLEDVQVNYVIPANLDHDVAHFIEDYNYALEKTIDREVHPNGPFAFLIAETDPAELQAVFTKMFFLDNTMECEVTGGGNKVIAHVSDADSPMHGLQLKILREMPGVLSLSEARVEA